MQVQVEESTGRFNSCQLHDLMRDLCLRKGKEDNFLKIVPPVHENKQVEASSPCNAIRRFCVAVDWNINDHVPPKHETTAHVRSVLLMSQCKHKWGSYRQNPKSTLKSIALNLSYLELWIIKGSISE